MAVTWNSGDKTANVTLSGGSLIATTTSSSFGGVRATNSIAGGACYFEVILLTQPANNVAIGWANATAAFTTFIGVDKNGVGYEPQSGSPGQTVYNSTNIGTAFLGSQYDTICIAFDATALKFWTKVGTGYWNASSTADPAAGTGGFSTAAMNAGPYFPVFGANFSGASLLANFGATDFGYSVPTGFSALDTNVQAYNASSKFLGYGALSNPDPTASASKLLGFGGLPPSQNAAVSSKFISYAILSVTFGRSRVYFLD